MYYFSCMNNLARDGNRNIAIFINDFDQEFADGLQKLAKKLQRPLRGIILVDSTVKKQKRNAVDTASVFEEIVCDFSNDAVLRRIIKPLEKHLLLVTCSSEYNQPYLERLLPHVPYILGPTESSLVWSTHKAKMRELLNSYDNTLGPSVQSVTSDDETEIQKVLTTLTFPVIVKPTGLAASLLVSKAHDEAELRAILKKSFAAIHDIYQRDKGRGHPSMIVEEFIEGDMYSVDAYVSSTGQVWCLPLLRSKSAHVMGYEGFYTYRADSYHELKAKDIKTGQSVAEQAVHALGLRSCVAHIELFHTSKGWKIIELGPRAGGQRQDVYSAAYGIDHAYNELLVKIGLEPEILSKAIAHSTTVNVYADEEGVITTITGIAEAKANPSTYALQVKAKPGDMALLSHNGGKLLVRGVLSNTDKAQLEKDAELVRSSIKIVTKKS